MRSRRELAGTVAGLVLAAGVALAVAVAGCAAPPTAGPTAADRTPAVTPSPTSPTTSPAGRATRQRPVPRLPDAKALPTPVRHSTSPVPLVPAGGAGNPAGHAAVPAEGQPVDTSHPTRVIGNGTPASCSSAAVVTAVAAGGTIRFACGPRPVTITMLATAKIRNGHPVTVLDGGGLVTLSGGGQRRILYQNTCDSAQGWTTSHCQDQDSPRLVVQNLTFADGNSTGEHTEGGGGGAIFVRGGRFSVVNARFVRNRCDLTGPDLGGAAIRVLDQGGDRPVYVVSSTFGGAPGLGGVCANGGALSSIGVSWVVLNSLLTDNSALGWGANPARPGSPGGGSGGAIYTDGNQFTVTLAGTAVTGNHAREGGGAVFFVSNDRTGTMLIDHSTLRRNPNDGFATAGFPGIFFLGARPPTVLASTVQ